MHKIAVIGGDGTGPEVVAEGVKVMEAVCAKRNISIEFTQFDLGGTRYLKTGEVLNDDTLEELKKFDAIYLGAVGHRDVKPGILEKGLLLKLRFELDQYINLRPIKLFPNIDTPLKDKGPEDIDYVVVRENTGGLYTGTGGISMKGTEHEVAVQSMVYNRHQVERCLRFAFEYTQKNGKKARGKGNENTLALIGKTNVLTHVFDLWERAFHEIGEKDYPDVKREYYHVDATCLYMVQCPEMFDVMVTTNMFGDIVTDLGAITQGGLGVAAGGNINPKGLSMFEPIGGTAPSWTGKNAINPMAAIGAAAMMIDFLGEEEAAKDIDAAMTSVFKKMKSQVAGEMGFSTSEIGDMLAKEVS